MSLSRIFYLHLTACLSSIMMVLLHGSALAQPADTAGHTERDTTAIESFISQTSIGGYGEARYHYDLRFDTAQADLQRATLFFSHIFSPSILFYSELEVEDGKVEGGTGGGEVSYEQMYLRFRLGGDNYLMAGLITPRIGIMNENHLPTTFNGTDRPFVETLIIPSTWRDIGVEVQGPIDAVSGMNYSVGIINGLSSANFEYGQGINGGSFEGKLAQASELAVTGALQYYTGTTRLQASAYYGGTVGLDAHQADSLQLASGPFGTPVFLTEADVMSTFGAFSFRALGTFVSIPDAQEIDRAYANNTPQAMQGAYIEIGCDLLHNCPSKESLTVFTRAEYLDLNEQLPANGVYNGELLQRYLVAGLTWKPLENVSVKGDYVYRFTGPQNPALQINPIPEQVIYYQANGFWDIGMAYSF